MHRMSSRSASSGPMKKSYHDVHLRSKLPQHLLLYLALFCSMCGVVFSVQTYVSNDFVYLQQPLDVGIFFKNVSSIGLSSWEICNLRQGVVDEIVVDGADSILGAHYRRDFLRELYPSRTSIQETPIFIEDGLDLDDGLVSADFPYRDDDEILAALPPKFWMCQAVRFSSSDTDDIKWIFSRVFMMFGTITGVTATCLLAFLIVTRSKRVSLSVRESRQKYKYMTGPTKELWQKELHLRSLDTLSVGYRPIASLLMMTYLFQCVTFIFLDSKICRDHGCKLSTGAVSLIIACVLWVTSSILVYLMMRKIWKHQHTIRAHNEMRRNLFIKLGASKFDFIDEDGQTSSSSSRRKSSGSPVGLLNDTADTDLNDTSSLSATISSTEMQQSLNAIELMSLSSSLSLESLDISGDTLSLGSLSKKNIHYSEQDGRSVKPEERLSSLM